MSSFYLEQELSLGKEESLLFTGFDPELGVLPQTEKLSLRKILGCQSRDNSFYCGLSSLRKT